MKTQNFNLTGKSIVITGATSGIGLAAATEFSRQGAFVIGVGRSETRITQALETIKRKCPTSQIRFLLADLAQQKEVRALGRAVESALAEKQFNHLDILINNAGVYLENKQFSDENIEKTFAVNHLAGFALTHELLSLLEGSKIGRVMTISSYAHRTTPMNLKRISNPCPYIGLLAYKRSKLCNILFTSELNRRYQSIEAFAIDPGLVDTAIASKSKPGISDWVWQRRRKKGTGTEVPIKTLLFLSNPKNLNPDKGFYIRDSKTQTPSRNARRADLAKALWALSCQLTGTDW